MTQRPDVLVLGGGIAGLSTALALADAGRQVVVLDEPRAGSASRAAAGMLAPQLEFSPEHREAAVAARDFYPGFLTHLHEVTGVDVPLDRNGIIELADDEAAVERLRRGIPATSYMDERAVEALEPRLHATHGGVLHPLDGAVDPRRLMDALVHASEAHPNLLRAHETAVALRVRDDGASVLTANASHHLAPHVVLATGAWAGSLNGLPRRLPVRPIRGELLLLTGGGLGHVVYGAGGYLVPRSDGILVGATSDDAGFAAVTTDAGRVTLLSIAARAIPGLASRRIVDHWAGLRPMSPDHLPILGRDPDHAALSYACGMSRNGILFAPWAAAQLARELDGQAVPELSPFGVERFDAELPTEPSA